MCLARDEIVGVIEPRWTGGPGGWLTHIAVHDVDGIATVATDLGARVLVAPTELPDRGRRVVLTDPDGAGIAAWQPPRGHGPPARAGTCPVWPELRTPDPHRAEDFYAIVFGWELRVRAAGGADWLVGDRAVGAVTTLPTTGSAPSDRRSSWLAHFPSTDIRRCVAEVRAGGGAVIEEPQDTAAENPVLCSDRNGFPFGVRHADPGPCRGRCGTRGSTTALGSDPPDHD
ncbi:hypothetical protein GCM10027563_12590 [Parasphingorhabdus pacifica]